MTRLFRYALTGALAVSFAPMAQAHGFVSVLQILDDMVNTPYECADYDPATDSCSGVSLMYSEEGILYNTNWFALPNPGGAPWVFEAFSEYELNMGWGCPPYDSTGPGISYSSGGQPELGAAYAQQLQAQVATNYDPFEPCAGYYPVAPGVYDVEFRHGNGDLADRPRIRVQFFASPKSVRP
ncbi:hypothetical protein [Phaeobacter sp. HF9A]|uniref:hypothetical protein n=1 Tax=Phaeobacter sp. HF9A TaxID=2721561 RepID=UPI0014310DB9|nr:hypothetical protein [Phaeobacter sp. HF9A]NIZ15547.1 hypothetical protein [Phaeobacter sp. HF9A]